jgi:excinuclease UvrABC nuclease subunit
MSHDLYFLYDKYGELLYVGESQDAHKRILDHEKRSWGHLIDHIRIVRFYGSEARATAKADEIEAIKYEHPKYNLTHNPDEWAARQALAEIGEFDKRGREHCYDVPSRLP